MDGATTLPTVLFSHEACSFYDFIRGNNDILPRGNCAIPCLELGLSAFLVSSHLWYCDCYVVPQLLSYFYTHSEDSNVSVPKRGHGIAGSKGFLRSTRESQLL